MKKQLFFWTMVTSFAIFSMSFIGCSDSDDYSEEIGIETLEEDLETRANYWGEYWHCYDCGRPWNSIEDVFCTCGAAMPPEIKMNYSKFIADVFSEMAGINSNPYSGSATAAYYLVGGNSDRVFYRIYAWSELPEAIIFYNEAIVLYDGNVLSNTYRKFFAKTWDDLVELLPWWPYDDDDFITQALQEYIETQNNLNRFDIIGRKDAVRIAANTVYKLWWYCLKINTENIAKNRGK